MNQIRLSDSSLIPHPSSLVLASSTEEFFDRTEDGVAVGDAAAHDVVAFAQHFMDVFVKLAAAVGTFHLAVTEQVHARQQLFGQNLQAVWNVVAPVVAVGKVE